MPARNLIDRGGLDDSSPRIFQFAIRNEIDKENTL
jgi:hypothetical protein